MVKHADGDHFLRQDLVRDYPVIVRAEGHYLWDDAGKRYLDGTSGGVGAVSIGHGVPEVLRAMADQAALLCHANVSVFNTRPAIQLAARIIRDFAPPGMSHVYFVSTGTESTELAVKMARRYHLLRGNADRYKVIARWGGYHGSSLGALSFSGRTSRRAEFHPYYFDVGFIPPPNCYRCTYGQTYPGCGLECAWALEYTIRNEGDEVVSAFITEAMSNTSGVLGAPPEYFPLVREICDEHDVLLIIDEVITGWGRTGANFAIDHWSVVPDMICTGKGIASGYAPLAATIVHEKVVEAVEPSGASVAGYTYAANPLSCAVGDAVLSYITENDLVQRSAQVGAEMHAQAQRLLDLPIVGIVRGKGMIVGVEYVANRETREPFAPEQAVCQTIAGLGLAQGLLIYAMTGVADGLSGDASVLKPPLTTPRDEVMTMIDILEGCILELQERLHVS